MGSTVFVMFLLGILRCFQQLLGFLPSFCFVFVMSGHREPEDLSYSDVYSFRTPVLLAHSGAHTLLRVFWFENGWVVQNEPVILVSCVGGSLVNLFAIWPHFGIQIGIRDGPPSEQLSIDQWYPIQVGLHSNGETYKPALSLGVVFWITFAVCLGE